MMARAARARDPIDPQSWAAVRAARSGVIGGVRRRSEAMPDMSCEEQQLRTREEGVVSPVRHE